MRGLSPTAQASLELIERRGKIRIQPGDSKAWIAVCSLDEEEWEKLYATSSYARLSNLLNFIKKAYFYEQEEVQKNYVFYILHTEGPDIDIFKQALDKLTIPY